MIMYYIYTSGNLETDVLLKHTIKDIGNIFFMVLNLYFTLFCSSYSKNRLHSFKKKWHINHDNVPWSVMYHS